ncbi:MAG: VCBS repeat-containing protein, partial [Verrucomicrobiales bacterium]|nr:VCBS repeat-containing protein [Verrucomicrobiales bacterium]
MHPPLFSRTRILLFSLSLLPFSEGISQMKPPKFEPLVIDDAVEIGYGIAIGDVDGDGAADILLADKRQISWYRSPNWKKAALARNLTLRDNVCLTAADLDGDGKVEVVVGAQWNPGETTDKAQSGAVFYLERPA